MAFVRSYGVPLVLAVLVHGLVFATFFIAWTKPVDLHDVVKPRPVQAKLVVMEAPKPKAKPKPTPPPAARPEPKPTPLKPTPTPPKPVAKPTPAPKKDPAADKARQQKVEAEKRKRLEALLASSFNEAKREEASALESSAETEEMQTYMSQFAELVSMNWSRPPSARNDMVATLSVDLVPTGDVVGVTIASSSGNAAFDRSAVQAVLKAAKFDVPKDPRVFERNFRKFEFVFQPGDLLR